MLMAVTMAWTTADPQLALPSCVVLLLLMIVLVVGGQCAGDAAVDFRSADALQPSELGETGGEFWFWPRSSPITRRSRGHVRFGRAVAGIHRGPGRF